MTTYVGVIARVAKQSHAGLSLDGLFEVRTNLGGGRIARVLFTVERGNAVLLHGWLELEEEGILEEATEHAIKAVISWQLQKTMEEHGLSKKSMAALMGTSRSQLDRLLDPESDAVTLKSLMRAARLVGKKIKIDLVDAA